MRLPGDRMRLFLVIAVAVVSLAFFAPLTTAQGNRILVQSTTSTQNSGLYDHLVPLFEAETGLNVAVIAVGTGQAVRNAMNGDADVLLVHAKEAEEAFVAEGHGVERFDLMYNDFVIVGPRNDPSDLSAKPDLTSVLNALQTGRSVLVSRGDDSGTHKAEIRLWQMIGAAPSDFGSWYRETGSGMGATIRVAVQTEGYVLTDRATWIAYKDKSDHAILFEGDEALFNQYGVIAVDPARHPHVNKAGADAFVGWLLGPKGQAAIAAYRLGGEQLFFPNASPNTQ